MKILELTLINFAPILSGMGKESVTLDLRGSNDLINVLIGKIGSGKTYLLSHLQPYATIGTLDVRNGDDPILSEKDGKKRIVYEKNGHEYEIEHLYTWTGKSHTKKSYIKKDKIELNENGNQGSFADIVKEELGIEESHLRLIRIGNNVTNFIHMKATDRKTFVANLIDDTDIYLLLHKKWNEELKTINTKVSILMNKLNSYGKDTLENIQASIEDLEMELSDVASDISTKEKEKYKLEADINTLMFGMNDSEWMNQKNFIQSTIESLSERKQELNELLQSFRDCPDVLELSKEIGSMDQRCQTLESDILSLREKYEEKEQLLNSFNEKKKIIGSNSYIASLRHEYTELEKQMLSYKQAIQNFQCHYTSVYLSDVLDNLSSINVLIYEISQYDADIIRKLFHSDASVIPYTKKQIEKLNYRKITLTNNITNIKFGDTYTPNRPLYLPPLCPTKTCPYYDTHPITLQKKIKKSDAQLLIEKYQNEIHDIDIEIFQLTDYPIIYTKIQSLKSMWNNAQKVLSDIGALRSVSLLNTLTIDRNKKWYDYDTIINTIESIKKRDKYFELQDQMKAIASELSEVSNNDLDDIEKSIANLEIELSEIAKTLEQKSVELRDTKESLTSLNNLYLKMSSKSSYEMELTSVTEEYKSAIDQYQTMELNRQKILDIHQSIQSINVYLVEKTAVGKKLQSSIENLKVRYREMKDTGSELNDTLEEQKYMKALVSSVSPKTGIPLYMVELFLDSCRDMINDLIYDICEDSIEILPFHITESEFKIPYMINGQKIDDISKASQGQSSIVSTAFSFALVRKSGSDTYNIPLLDEVDAPLHKSDKQKFIAITLKHLENIGSEQCFVITHDENTFDGYPVQVIMTTDERVNEERYSNVIRL